MLWDKIAYFLYSNLINCGMSRRVILYQRSCKSVYRARVQIMRIFLVYLEVSRVKKISGFRHLKSSLLFVWKWECSFQQIQTRLRHFRSACSAEMWWDLEMSPYYWDISEFFILDFSETLRYLWVIFEIFGRHFWDVETSMV